MTQRTFNRHQPIRPRTDPETGEILLHRTFPRLHERMPKLMETHYQLCQMRLYRHCVNGEMVNHAAASAIKEWIGTGRNTLGSTILQSVQYEARKLMNRKSMPKATVVYSFNNLLELQYGLEWQICTWLRTFLKERDAHIPPYSGPEAAEHELEILATMPEEEYITEYEDPLRLMSDLFVKKNREIDWHKLCIGLEEDQVIMKEPAQRGPAPKSVL